MASARWRNILDKTVENVRASKKEVDLPREWLWFSSKEIVLLKHFSDPNVSLEFILDTHDLRQMFECRISLVTQCLTACLEPHLQFDEKLVPLHEIVCAWVAEGSLTKLNAHEVRKQTLLKIVDMCDTTLIAKALKLAGNRHVDASGEEHGLLPKLSDNASSSYVLLVACQNESYEIVRELVLSGYRLCTRRYTRQVTKTKSFKFRPLLIAPKKDATDRSAPEKDDDDVRDVFVLKNLTKPCYILSRYLMAAENNEYFRFLNGESDVNYCDCQKSQSCEWAMRDYYEHQADLHKCPRSLAYIPVATCNKHVECSDPVARCFSLSKHANGYAARVPECRTEYKEIARRCMDLPTQLLDHCQNMNEVKLLLGESAGATEYLRSTGYLSYPRLHLAIELNYKEFVAHKYCQQMLRDEWHGRVDWQGRSKWYKLLYVAVQVLLSPLHAWIYAFFRIGRDLGYMIHIHKSLAPPHRAAGPLLQTYIDFSYSRVTNFDVPLNRFITFSGFYAVFVALVFVATLQPDVDETGLLFTPCHVLLGLYGLGFFFKDAVTLMTRRSLRSFFKFWRIYDFLLYATLLVGLSVRLAVMVKPRDMVLFRTDIQ